MTNIALNNLSTIVQDVNDALGLEEALAIIVQRVKAAMRADAVSVYLRHNKSDQLVLMASDGLDKRSIGKIKLMPGQGLVGLVIKHSKSINLKDAHAHKSYHFAPDSAEISYHGFLGVPIIQHRYVAGVLVVRQTKPRRFSSDDEAFLVTLAAQLAGAISHAEKAGELTRLLEGTEDNGFIVNGLAGSPGIAIGNALVIFPSANFDAIPDITIEKHEVDDQIQALNSAIDNVIKEFDVLSKKMDGLVSTEELALFDVFKMMLKSDSLIQDIVSRIKAGQWAQGALRDTIFNHVKQFKAMDDAYLRERAIDISDLGRRILSHLQALKTTTPPEVSGPVVLVGDEITVSQFSEAPLQNIVAIISSKGSSSSHVAILSRALGIPSIMGVEHLATSSINGQQIVVNGYNGQAHIKPSQAVLDEFKRLLKEEQQLDKELTGLIDLPSETLDGKHVSLHVNTGLLEDIAPSLKCGAEGVGLYRTEIPFLMRDGFPNEAEQAHIYRQVLQRFSPAPVTFRTLDIGGDKGLSYFPVVEENPFLGWRGIRIMLDHPDIFLTQIRAILKVNVYENNLRLMLPMVSDIGEVDEAIGLIKKAHRELTKEGIIIPFPSIGLMIEVPSAVYQMEAFCKRVDFFSIGSNDLTQYLMAVDRNNNQVADLYNHFHPSVLRSIQHIVEVAHQYNKPVSVCGEMAGDPASALALIGMGVDNLSMSAGSLLRVKWATRSFTYKQTKELVEQALAMEKFSDIFLLFNNALIEAGLGGLVKAGK